MVVDYERKGERNVAEELVRTLYGNKVVYPCGVSEPDCRVCSRQEGLCEPAKIESGKLRFIPCLDDAGWAFDCTSLCKLCDIQDRCSELIERGSR